MVVGVNAVVMSSVPVVTRVCIVVALLLLTVGSSGKGKPVGDSVTATEKQIN